MMLVILAITQSSKEFQKQNSRNKKEKIRFKKRAPSKQEQGENLDIFMNENFQLGLWN